MAYYKKTFLFILISLILCLVQIFIISNIPWLNNYLSLPLVLIIIASLRFPKEVSVPFAIAVSLLIGSELYDNYIYIFWILIPVFISFLQSTISSLFTEEDNIFLFKAKFVLIFSFFNVLINIIIYSFYFENLELFFIEWKQLLFSPIINLLAYIILYLPLKRVLQEKKKKSFSKWNS